MAEARYDGLADWYEGFRPALSAEELDVLARLLGPGDGRCLDVGCGTGLAAAAVEELGWSVVGVDISADVLAGARARGIDVVQAAAEALPFEEASFDAAVSFFTHTDIDEFAAAMRDVARVLRPGAAFVYVGCHPAYRPSRRYDGSAPGVWNSDGVRVRVGAVHLTLHDFFGAFSDAGFKIERIEELGERDYPHVIALRARR